MRLTFLEPLTDNPIFVRELRRRMRGKLIMYMTNAFIAVMCVITFVVVLQPAIGIANGTIPGRSVGAQLFRVLTMIQAIVVLLIAPVITAGMATVERERKTFEFLKVTTLSPFTFVLGGLMSTMLYVMIVLICALPLICIAFLYGGVSPREISLMFVKLLGAALLLSAAGLFISSTRDRTKSAQTATLILVIFAFAIGFNQRATLFSVGYATQVQPIPGLPLVMPEWVFHLAGIMVMSYFLLLIAGRKLYVGDNRPLLYRHSLVIILLAGGALLAPVWGNNTYSNASTWLWISYPLMFLLVATLCLHRVEIGNEAWALKKRFAPFRRIDESLLFAALFAGLWAVMGWVWASYSNLPAQAGVPTLDQISPVLPLAFGQMAVTLFFVAMASRFFAHYSDTRGEALRGVLWLTLPLYIVLPLTGLIINSKTANPDNIIGGIFIMMSPLGGLQALSMVEGQSAGSLVRQDSATMSMNAAIGTLATASVILLIASAVIGYVHWYRHVRNQPTIDYSYKLSV